MLVGFILKQLSSISGARALDSSELTWLHRKKDTYIRAQKEKTLCPQTHLWAPQGREKENRGLLPASQVTLSGSHDWQPPQVHVGLRRVCPPKRGVVYRNSWEMSTMLMALGRRNVVYSEMAWQGIVCEKKKSILARAYSDVCVHVIVCVHICVWVFVGMWVDMSMCVCVYVHVCICGSGCMHV